MGASTPLTSSFAPPTPGAGFGTPYLSSSAYAHPTPGSGLGVGGGFGGGERGMTPRHVGQYGTVEGPIFPPDLKFILEKGDVKHRM
jgi:hypothetical protein